MLGERTSSGIMGSSRGEGGRETGCGLLWLSRKRRFAAALFVLRLDRLGDSSASLKYFAKSLHVARDSRTLGSEGGSCEERI